MPPTEPLSLNVGVVRPLCSERRFEMLDRLSDAPGSAEGSEASAAADRGVARPEASAAFRRVGGGLLALLLGVAPAPVPATPVDGARAYMLNLCALATMAGSGVCMLSLEAPVYRIGVDDEACDSAEPGRLGVPPPVSELRTAKRGIIESRFLDLASPTLPCADGGR